ncbi:MAG: hypothetical protein R2796_07375 [Chitinophagaceae bacterium]|nr:hypothetical protein [Chitinophagaceae bacterium]HQV06353.1 hypothetical protein [Chitinophagaceae bacterium]
MMTDDMDKLRAANVVPINGQPFSLRIIARIFSYIFHPVFVPVYVVYFMVYWHPNLFTGFSSMLKARTLIMGFVMYCFFPVVTVLLLKALNFITSIKLHSQKDRIIPLVACGVWYFWIWYVWRNLPDYPAEAIRFTLAIWISVSLALMANIVMKISLHTISMGVALAFMLLLAFSQPLNFGLYLSVTFLATGIVCTSRLLDSNHTNKEIYSGLALGICSMLLAWVAG